jgi:chromosome segregation ATPase
MTIDLDSLLKFLGFAFSVATAGYAWMSKKDGATAHQMREIEQRQQAADARMVQLETQLKSVPTQEAFHRLELSMQDIRGTVDQIKDHYKATTATLVRLEDFIMNLPKQSPARRRNK